MLREAEYRKVGAGQLSLPVQIDPSADFRRELDGHLVSLEGVIIEGYQLEPVPKTGIFPRVPYCLEFLRPSALHAICDPDLEWD